MAVCGDGASGGSTLRRALRHAHRGSSGGRVYALDDPRGDRAEQYRLLQRLPRSTPRGVAGADGLRAVGMVLPTHSHRAGVAGTTRVATQMPSGEQDSTLLRPYLGGDGEHPAHASEGEVPLPHGDDLGGLLLLLLLGTLCL